MSYSLVWTNLRNLTNIEEIRIPGQIKLVDTVQGSFPVDTYKPIFFECTKNNQKQHLLARSNTFNQPPQWYFNGIIELPIYELDNNLSEEEFIPKWKSLLKQWHNTTIPDNIPAIALAAKVIGNYCDERESQLVFVILIWHNKIAKIFTLDWFEGPFEDCISPEWYLNSTPIFSIDNLQTEVQNIIEKLPNWNNQCYSIFLNPIYFDRYLSKFSQKYAYNHLWLDEFRYTNKVDFCSDLLTLTGKISFISFF